MKKVLLILVLPFLTISLGNFLNNDFELRWNRDFETCKTKLLAQNNYQSIRQAAECVRQDKVVRYLGYFLWRE